MKKIRAAVSGRYASASALMVALWASITSSIVLAALPTAVDPTSGAANGNFVAWLQGWVGDSAEAVALFISTSGFLWMGWIIISRFNETRNSRDPDWGAFGLTAVIAGVVMVICTYMLTEAVAVI